ncbi:hypothetical protein KEM60_01203 [Austwickia sp. TVS 96-490-7B]|uniref:LytR C-terminal domain-containing protein n=1 Tax=Austwickia sp. TVS 96-490-7B TaxID=2830843 RepID=UPI001C56A00A|nr:LytR C-terminal domain-containing protein [Austwickia sp. TVS 96-490-7B]MBW3085011.1 hypothetical protein [Austwickia sp. TVS 96-490-7B]
MTEDHDDGYAEVESERRRAIATLSAMGSVLLVTFVLAFSFIQGWFGSDSTVPVAAKPSAKASTAPADKPSATCTPAVTGPPVSEITVNVYNSTQRVGLASTTGKTLGDQGFKIGKMSNDPSGRKVDGVAEIRFGESGAAKAEVVLLRFPGAVKVQDNRTDDTVDVSIGERFASVNAVATEAMPRC